ncbi:MAG TPA: tetratricopeptide repeat protein [Acidisarcina sp.]
MNRLARLSVLAAATLSVIVPITGCKSLQARDQLNKGVRAYKSQRYEEAIEHFQQAVNLDPSLPMTNTYLATAYAQQVVAGADTPENLRSAELAINGYQKVLTEKPKDINSLKGIAAMYMNTNRYDEAKLWQKKVIDADPTDADAAYTVGVIDWTLARKNAVKDLAAAGLQDMSDGNPKAPKPVCQKIVEDNTPLVDEGLQYLNKAVDIRNNYDAAMAYINLLYRRKADLECGNDPARKSDLAQADSWLAKAMGTRKANDEKKAQTGGIVLDTNGNSQ